MDTLDQKDSVQSQNAEEKVLETTENQVNNEENIVENSEETEKVAPKRSTRKATKKEVEEEVEKEETSDDLKDVSVEQVEDKKEEVEAPIEKEEAASPVSEEKPVTESTEQTEDTEPVVESKEELPSQEEETIVEEPAKEEPKETPSSDENVVVELTVVEIEEPSVESQTENYSHLLEEELVAKAQELMESVSDSYAELKEKLDEIKHSFYKKFKLRQEELKKVFIEAGNLEADFVVLEDELENQMKAILNSYREKRNAEIQAIEKEKQDNLNAKNKILEELKNLLESTEDFGKKVPVFQKLQLHRTLPHF